MTLRQKRRQFLRWLRSFFSSTQAPAYALSRRAIRVEPLESRQLLAGDVFSDLLGSSYDTSVPPLTGEGELVGEGEDAVDLVAFAKQIADSGTRFFGAAWCPFCTEQKELFEDGGKYLPFEEVTNPDRTLNQLGIDEGIETFPTWQFPDNTRATGVLSLNELATRVFGSNFTLPVSSTPSFADLPDVQVEMRAPLHVPIDAYDPNGNPLTITVTSSNPQLLEAEVLQGNRSLLLDVQGFGDMVFELFEQRAPRPTGRVVELAQDGFYDGVTFHRIINGFVIQGGDPLGTGSGGSSLGDFDDQFHLDLQHNATGILSYAKSSDDTNDSQFFITEGQQRHLDFNHSVFGQLVEGESNRDGISNTATSGSGQPTNTVTINSASIFNDTENGTVLLRPTGNGTGSATITVVVTDNEGNSSSQQFQATVINDTVNGAPFLNPVETLETEINTPLQFTLTSQDKEGDTVQYEVEALNNGQPSFGLTVDQNTGLVTVTPPTGFTGELQFAAAVSQTTATDTQSKEDIQVLSVQVSQTNTTTPTSVDLQAGSDSGVSSTDNITNSESLIFDVAGTVSGATVEVLVDGSVVGSATASGATTAVTVSNVAALGEGSLLFSARQRLNGQTSEVSPELSVVLDRTGPPNFAAGIIPVTGVVDSEISVNLEVAGEGQGLTYQLSGAPSGMQLGATNGELLWTPTTAQLGVNSFSILMQDVAGNTTTQAVTINVIEDPIVSIGLRVVDTSGQPINNVDVGTEFRVQMTVQDLRGFEATGVFAAFADLLYNPDVLELVGADPISGVAPFENGIRGDISTPGLINELGAFTSSTQQTDGSQQTVIEIAFRAKAVGDAGLVLESAEDSPQSDTLVFSPQSPIPADRIDYGTSPLTVGVDFELANDIFNFDEDASQQTLEVLTNDDAGNSTLTIVEVSSPTGGGSVAIATNGQQVLYTPAANFNGAETFVYTVENQVGLQASATVTVQITAVNDPPVAVGDDFTVEQNSSLNVLDVLANDNSGVDDNSENLIVSAVSSGSQGGTILIGSSGASVSYTPKPGFLGTETFTYTLSDGLGGTSTATVSVAVEVGNPPPVAVNDKFTVQEDAAQSTYDVLGNDTTDDDTETLSISDVGTSQQGSLFQVSSDGLSVLYAPAENFSGTEILTYTLRDSGGAEATGLVTFTVTPVNDAPVAQDDTATVVSSQASSTIEVLANDSDVDGDTLQITAVSQPSSGSVTIASDARSVAFSPPNADFEGTLTFTYTVSDGNGESDTATVTVNVADFIPRNISGHVLFDAGSSSNLIHSFPLKLTGNNQFGESVDMQTTVGTDGSFVFSALAPGQYNLQRDALPFLIDQGQAIQIQSAATDGDAVQDIQVQAQLRPQFFDIRDFLGSSFMDGLTVALNSDGTPAWTSARGAWSQVSTLDIGATDDTLSINAVDADNANLSASLTVNSNTQAYEVGRESPYRLIRIPGTPQKAGLTEAQGEASTANASGEGEAAAASTNALVGEGEATGVAAPSLVGVRRQLIDEPDPSETGAAAQETLVAEGEWQGSTEVAVDQAMQDVLPSLRRSLSSNLEDTLAVDGEESHLENLNASDELFSRFWRVR